MNPNPLQLIDFDEKILLNKTITNQEGEKSGNAVVILEGVSTRERELSDKLINKLEEENCQMLKELEMLKGYIESKQKS